MYSPADISTQLTCTRGLLLTITTAGTRVHALCSTSAEAILRDLEARAGVGSRERLVTSAGHPLLGDWWSLHEHGLRALAEWQPTDGSSHTREKDHGDSCSDDNHASVLRACTGALNSLQSSPAASEGARNLSELQTAHSCHPATNEHRPLPSLANVVRWCASPVTPPTREDVAEVDGAFLIRGALTCDECAALARVTVALQPGGSSGRCERGRARP